MIDRINTEGERLGLKINVDKMNVMVNGNNIHHVFKFRYLGSWITEDLDGDSSIEETRVAFTNLRAKLSNKSLNLKPRYGFVRYYIYSSVLLYRVQTWIIKANVMKLMNVPENHLNYFPEQIRSYHP